MPRRGKAFQTMTESPRVLPALIESGEMHNGGWGEVSDFLALARAVCGTPHAGLFLTGVGWIGPERIDPADLQQVAALAQATSGESGFFETTLGTRYCAGVVLGRRLGALCVLDDPPRAPLTAQQQDLLRALGNQVARDIEQRRGLTRLEPLGQLGRGIAHDMNNVLQTIVGALNTVEKLIETDNLERAPRFLAAAMRSAHRGGELTRHLQRLARREPGGAKTIELNSLVRSQEDLIRHICGERITVQIHLTDTATEVRCDPVEIEDVLLTHVIHSSEAIPDGGTLIITSREPRTTAGRDGVFACICIHDTGTAVATGISRALSGGGWTEVEGSTVNVHLPAAP